MNPDVRNIPYGSHERQVLDIYLASANEPGPVLIFLHGGGYIGGDKSDIQNFPLLPICLDAGITVVSANYRFITTHSFPAPMEDGTRVIQWVRHRAGDYGWDPAKIALSGSSAGAHISLWNAMKGDLSKPDSEDPLERCSSTVSAVISYDGQVTKDQHFYKKYDLGNRLQPNLLLFYGVGSEEELEHPDIRKLSYEASAINFVSAEAPPVLMIYGLDFGPVPFPEDTPVSEIIHHPLHGSILKEEMAKYGRACLLRHASDPLREGELFRFLREAFQQV